MVRQFFLGFLLKKPLGNKFLLTSLKGSRFIVVCLEMLLLYAILFSSKIFTLKNFFIGSHGEKEIPLGSCNFFLSHLAHKQKKQRKQTKLETN